MDRLEERLQIAVYKWFAEKPQSNIADFMARTIKEEILKHYIAIDEVMRVIDNEQKDGYSNMNSCTNIKIAIEKLIGKG